MNLSFLYYARFDCSCPRKMFFDTAKEFNNTLRQILQPVVNMLHFYVIMTALCSSFFDKKEHSRSSLQDNSDANFNTSLMQFLCRATRNTIGTISFGLYCLIRFITEPNVFLSCLFAQVYILSQFILQQFVFPRNLNGKFNDEGDYQNFYYPKITLLNNFPTFCSLGTCQICSEKII